MCPSSTSGLLLKSVKKTFTNKTILHNINLQISPGQFVAICGQSGVGKSTLLKLMSGLMKQSSGEIFLNGTRLNGPPSGVGLVTQNYAASLLPWFTVRKNVALPLLGKIQDKKQLDEKVIEIISRVGLEGSLNKYPSELSGGMQQRVALARAVITNPNLLFLDEPFASVDSLVRLELEDLLLDLVNNTDTITVLITHDVEEAIYLSDRVIVLAGSPAEVVSDIQINLGSNRNQLTTRGSSDFLNYRSDIYHLLTKLRN